ncbi:MAG: dihydropteroate synthase [Bacteroidales bacterium]|nr:dihydropteroate synthase [Bacteroidales bacterium]
MSNKDTSFKKIIRPVRSGNKMIDFSSPKIMGVLNLTPDSFYDGGKFQQEKLRVEQTARMLKEGADMIDLGAVSTRPGAEMIDEEEELKRIIWPLQLLVKEFPETIFSIDTYRSKVAKECIFSGAHIINDISGGQFDDKMFETVAELKVPYILMHLHGTPQNMQQSPISENIIALIRKYFKEKVAQLNRSGVKDIILDPGFGFGKTLKCNYAILNNLERLRIADYPILGGVSRKSMINKVINTKPSEALNGTTVLNTIALQNGANILRVHDVKEAREVIEIIRFSEELGDCVD